MTPTSSIVGQVRDCAAAGEVHDGNRRKYGHARASGPFMSERAVAVEPQNDVARHAPNLLVR
jgi:hypothetical protein